MALMSSRFNALPERPPTPPRETTPIDAVEQALDDIDGFLDSSNEVEQLMSLTSKKSSTIVSTPNHTPPPSAPCTKPSTRERKRVDFAPFISNEHYYPNKTHVRTVAPSKENANSPGLKELPPSRERSSLKSRSILKPGRPNSEQSSQSAHNFKSLAEMLEWALRSLAKDGRTQRIDAYVSLLGTLQAYDGLPDTKALKEKFRLLLHFVGRDMIAVDPTTEAPDIHLITRSMKFLMCLLRLPDLKDAGDAEECASIIDISLSILQAGEVSKTIANHHLEFLSQQRFGPHIITTDRAQRILEALRTIEERVGGNNVIGRRLMIYQRLVEQIPGLMASKVPSWLDHVFHAMLSDVKEIRENAISLGVTSGVKLGGRKEASKAIKELLARKAGDTTYCQFLIGQLEANLIPSKDENDRTDYSIYAPTIWSVPILYLRAIRPSSLDIETVKTMLKLPQQCLNKGDAKLKITAFRAWNRLVYAENISLSTSAKFRQILKMPIKVQLGRQKDGDFSKGVGQITLSSYCTLLYYGLRPDASFEQLDLYWDEYVAGILSELSTTSRRHAETGCHILISLFSSETVWNENRSNEEPWNLGIDELPRLDSCWVRSRLSKILGLVDQLVVSGVHSTTSPSFMTLKMTLWTALLSSVAEAGSKEIVSSMELKTAVAGITNLLTRTWSVYSRAANPNTTYSFAGLVDTTLDKLGPAIFAEKFLAKTIEDSFEAIATPSHRNRANGPLQSPVLHLLSILSASYLRQGAEESTRDQRLSALITSLIANSWESRTLRNAKLSILVDAIETIVRSADSLSPIPVGDEQRQDVDSLCAHVLDLATRTMSDVNSISGQSAQTGQDYKQLLQLMTMILRHTNDQYSAIEKLYSQSVATVRREAGEGGVILAMTEPHAAMFFDYLANPWNRRTTSMQYASMILKHDVRPKNRRVIEQARKNLWGGISSPTAKHADLEYKYLYPMVISTFGFIYGSLDGTKDSFESAMDFVVAVSSYIPRCSNEGVIFRQVQDGIALFVRDKARKIFNVQEGKGLSVHIQNLWDSVLVILKDVSRKDTAFLSAFDSLISAGLSSRRISIVNATVSLWNESFGAEDDLEYPPLVAKALRKLRPTVELQLPGMLPSTEVPDSPLSLVSSEDEPEPERELTPAKSPRMLFSPNRKLPSFRVSPSPSARPFSPERAVRSSPFRRALTPKSKLRHEDSQIQFEAIQSSPIAQEESQLLTERQKEVAERQRQDVVPLFHDISSPAAKRAMVISSDPLQSDGPDERPSTPLLQPALDDDLPGSSPTVASVSRRQSLSRRHIPEDITYGPWRDDEDIPSSPPRLDDEERQTTPEQEQRRDIASQALISPIRLQNTPSEESHDKLLERARVEFAATLHDDPVDQEIDIEREPEIPVPESVGQSDELRSLVEQDLVRQQIESEARIVAESQDDRLEEQPQDANGDSSPSSSVPAKTSNNDQGIAISSLQPVREDASSDGPEIGGSTTNSISLETFLRANTKDGVHEPVAKHTNMDSIPATFPTDDVIPETQFASSGFDASRIIDSFTVPLQTEDEQEINPRVKAQAIETEASQDEQARASQVTAPDTSSPSLVLVKRKRGRPSKAEQALRASHSQELSVDDRLSQEQSSQEFSVSASPFPSSQANSQIKRKRGRLSMAGEAKRSKAEADDLDIKTQYFVGYGNPRVQRPSASKLPIEDDDSDTGSLIVVLPEGSNKNAPRIMKRPTRPIPSAVDRTPSQSQNSEAEEMAQNRKASPDTMRRRTVKVPTSGGQQSSRLSEMAQDDAQPEQSTMTPTSQKEDSEEKASTQLPKGLQAVPAPKHGSLPEPKEQRKIPSLNTRQSSRLSEMSEENPTANATTAPELTSQLSKLPRSESQATQSAFQQPDHAGQHTPSQIRQSSRHSPGSSPQYDGLPLPTRVVKRTISQSKEEVVQAVQGNTVVRDTPVTKRLKITPRTPSTNTAKASQKAYVAVTPGDTGRAKTSSSQVLETVGKNHEIGKTAERYETQSSQEGDAASSSAGPSRDALAQNTAASLSQNVAEGSQSSQGSQGRTILSPRSIMARLKGILVDCKTLVFGTQEQREIDDVLFEVKAEVFKNKKE